MKKLALIILLFPLLVFSQEKITQLNYVNHLIDIPKSCTANSEYEITCENFSAQWLYLSEEMYNQNLHKKFIKQFKSQTNAEESGEIQLYSLMIN